MADNDGDNININENQNQTIPQNTNSNTNPHDPSLPNSQYFIGANENSGALLVTQMLDSSNYHSWATSMKRALHIKIKLGFIDGSIYEPTNIDSPLVECWLRFKDIVITWLQNTMAVDIKASTLYAETAYQLLLELEQLLALQNDPRIYKVKQSIAGLLQGHDAMSTYFSKLKILLDELMNYEHIPYCTCGGLKTVVSNQDRDWVMKFLMGFNDSYKALKAQILLIKPFPKLNEVYSTIQQDKKRRDNSTDMPSTEGMVLVSKIVPRESEKRNYCTFYKIPGHSLERCFRVYKDNSVCIHCQMLGHIINNCFKIHGYPPGHKLYGKPQANITSTSQISLLMVQAQEQVGLTQEQYTQLIAFLKPQINQLDTLPTSHVQGLNLLSSKHIDTPEISCTYTCLSAYKTENKISSSIPWVMDTGATDHMVCLVSFLTTIKSKISQSVALPNGTMALATHIESFRITDNL